MSASLYRCAPRAAPALLLGLALLLPGCNENSSDGQAAADGAAPAVSPPGRDKLVRRLAEEVDKSARESDGLRLRMWIKGRRMVKVLGADKTRLRVQPLPTKDEGEKTFDPAERLWASMGDDEVLGIARAIARDDARRLMLAGEMALEFGYLDQAGEFLTDAHLADPKLFREAQKLGKRLSPLSGSPAEDLKRHGLPALSAPDLYLGHPRLFLRDEPWGPDGKGLTVAALQARAKLEAYAPMVEALQDDYVGLAPLALCYLATGDACAADRAVEILQHEIENGGTTSDGDELEEAAIAYDWLCHYPGFDLRRRIRAQDRIAAAADKLIKRLEVGSHIFHTRMYSWANGVLFAGLALMGEHPRAETWLNFGYRYWRTRLMPARQHQGGAWQNSFAYGRKYMVRSTFQFLSVWDSVAGLDLWKEVREKQGDWAREMFYFIAYSLRRDGTHPQFGDCFSNGANTWDFQLALQAAAHTGDPHAAAYAEMLYKHYSKKLLLSHYGQSIYGAYPLLYYDPQAPKADPAELPMARVFGMHSMGCVVMRGGWGDWDPWIFFKCGDYFDNHGHFDQGHFEIFCWKPLLLDSGYYDGMDTPHATRYFKRAIAHNTILIADPSDPKDTGDQRRFSYQVAGNMEAYFAAKQCQTGDLLDFRCEKDYAVAVGEAAEAYDPAKVRQFTRTLVYLPPAHLIVHDLVRTAKPGMKVTLLLHYPTAPKIEGNRVEIENDGARLVSRTLLPANAKIADLPGFMVNGENVPPKRKRISEDWMGAGRVEVTPGTPGGTADGDTVRFLHVLTIGGEKTAEPEVQMTEKNGAVELQVGPKRLTFAADGKSVKVK